MKVNAARPKIVSIIVTTLISGLLVSIPNPANAVPLSSPNCTLSVGLGGSPGFSTNQAGHGCVIIKYNNGSADVYETFNYTGADQSWTSPASTTALTFYLVGAGGGAMNAAGRGPGASGGFATGSYSAASSTVFKIIVGQGGNGTEHTLNTYGGGGKADYGSGGGRSAIRVGSQTEDLITAGGAGGGGYDAKCGGAGGGTLGQDAVIRTANGEHGKGGTQTAGGAGGYSTNGKTGGTGTKYQGGLGQDQSGGGGGGYWGGGGGGDNIGAGGGSGYLHPSLITSGQLVQGTCTTVGNSSALSFAISYDGNGKTGGSVPVNTTVNAFASASLAANSGTLVRTNYAFSGWNTAADGGGTSYAAGETGVYVNKDTTLYAQWSSTITYNGNGYTSAVGTIPAATTVIGSRNVTLAAPTTLLRTNYTLAGWNTQADGLGTSYASGLTTYQSAGNATLYAKWTATITFDPNGATGSPATSSINSTPKTNQVFVNSISSIQVSDFPSVGTMVKTGFTFDGWNTAANGTGTRYSNTGVATPLLRYVATDYDTSTKIWPNSGSAGNSFDVSRTNMGAGAGITKIATTANTGGSNISFTTLKGDTTSKITFPNSAMSSYTLCHVARYAGATKQRIFTHPSNNWLSGYSLGQSGHYYGDAGSGTVGLLTGDTNWHLICDYNSNFRNNGTAAAAARNSIPANIGVATWSNQNSDWEIAEVLFYSRALNTFEIETLEASLKTTYGLTSYINPTTPATAGSYLATGNTTLYAQWTANNFGVTFDANGGSGTMANLPMVAGAAKALTANAFTRTGYTFAGWTTAADGTGTAYTNSQSVTLYADVTLYAKWLAGTYSVTFGNTPGTVGSTNPCGCAPAQTFTAGTPFNLSTNVWYRTGFLFAGWSIVSGNGSPVVYTDNQSVTLFGNTVLYTQWTPVFVVSYNANATAGTFTGTVPASANSVGGAAVTVATNSGNLGKSGLTFAGWNTKADGTGKTYLTGSSISPTASTVLYAMYLAACTPTKTTANGYVVLTFTGTGNCLWATPAGVTSIDLLAVGGGGGGAGNLGGGGGGGQVLYQTGLVPIGTGIITVGAGGAGGVGDYSVSTNHGKTGIPSGLVSSALNQVALGGSGGKGRLNATNLNPDGTPISSGWTGGGAAYQDSTAQITPDPGVGGNSVLGGAGSSNGGGGGGGAGGVGISSGSTSNAGAGGPGVSNSISGTSSYYGGGGGTALYGTNANWTGVGGLGGGANATRTGAGSAGTASTGGGGSSGYTTGGGAGGTGIVILRYAYGTPSAPTITAITGSANKLTVAFTAPASDGGSAITNYEYSLDGGVTWTALLPVDAASPIEITKLANGTTTLTNGTTYQVAIRALNGKTGLASNVFAGTTPLSPPTISAVAANASATVTVGAAAGESPTSFTVTALDSNGVAISPAKTCTVTAPATICVVTGLTNGTTYKFSAVANLGTQISTATTTATGVAPAAPVVTYNADGGMVGPSNTSTVTAAFNAGTPVVHPLPVRSGYNFTGWYNAAGTLVGQNGSNYEPAATITLTARWAGVTYSISYNGNGNTGGSVPATGSYVNGSVTPYAIVANTGLLTKTGYTFTAWVDGAGTTKLGNYSTGADLQLFAKWDPVTFQVTYDPNNGSGTPASQNYVYGTNGITLDNGSGTTRINYVFLGWSKTATGTTVSSPFIPTAATTLYARWAGSTYSVAFNSNGGSTSPTTASFTTGGAGLTLPSAGTRTGFTFASWNTQADGNGSNVSNGYTPTTDVTLYAKWTTVPYNITYNRGTIAGVAVPTTGQLTTFPANTTSTFSTLINLDLTIDTATVVSSTTYVFTGWKESGTNSVYKGGDSYRMLAADVTFTAQWVAIYTVSYLLNGGIGTMPADVTRTDGATEPLTNVVPTRVGYNFAGWKDQAGASVAGATFTVGATRYLLYAQWTPITYKVTYAVNGGTGGPSGTTDGNYGAIVTLDSATLPSYTNYKFVGWRIVSTTYSAGGTYILTADVTATAQWESTLSQIFYDVNGGTGTASPSVATQGVAVTLPVVGTFSRSGYSLTGWIGGGVTIPAATFTNSTTNSVTLVAQWTLLAPATPAASTAVAGSGSATITVNPGSSGGPADSYVVTALDSSGNPLSPSKSCNVYAPSTSCVISGLVDGTSYKFSSTATNSAGTSSSSVASSAVTPAGKPSIVTGASATASNASAVVRFTAPGTNGGAPIVSYTVTASTGQTCVITPTFPDPLGCTVNGLTNGTAVTFAVQANNGAYTSDSSTATIAVTPATFTAPPTGVTATTTSSNKATVTFTAPTDNGGSSITEYVVTSSPGGFTCTTTNPTTGCEITGLSNGTAYTFTAVAKNGVGSSTPSGPSSAITPVGKPSTPTNVIASAGNGSATVSFTAPNTGGSAITSYQVEAYDENGVPISPALNCTLNIPFPTPLACTFSNTLTNGLKYAFKVSASNAVGTSDSSTATVVITPANLIPPSADQILAPTGETTVGALQTSSVQFGGFPAPTVTYIWERCTTPSATSCTTISGATADTYTTTASDNGFYIRYKATGSNSGGTVVGTSVTTGKITDNPVLATPASGLNGTVGTAFSLAAVVTGGAESYTFGVSAGTLPAGLIIDQATGSISGTPTAVGSSVITLLVADAKGKQSTAVFTITIAAASSTVTPTPEPEPAPTCDSACQKAEATIAKNVADKAAADAVAKAAADKAVADAAAKVKADAAATSASTKASADAAAAAAAAKAAVDKAAAAALAQAAADAAAKTAASQAKIAADAQAAAIKAAADAAAALKNSTTTAAAKSAATKSANDAAAAATAAVKAAATAASNAVKAKTTAANATKKVDIAINSLNSKTAASQASAEANAIAAAAKAAANEAAAAAATKATEAKAAATSAQKAASDTAARIATEQKQAADAAALAKIAADAAVKATAEKVAAVAAATKASQDLATVLAEKATLAEQAAKATDQTARSEIQKKIDEVATKVEEVQKSVDAATTKADAAVAVQATAVQTSEAATKEATTQAAEAVAVKAESVTKTAEATKAVAAATVAAKVATAAKEAAAKVPAKATIIPKASTTTSKNSATATVTGLKPGQKVKVTVNVKDK